MEGATTPARAGATSQDESHVTPDSLVDKAFEAEMDRIMVYKSKYPALDTDTMMANAVKARDARHQDVFEKKLAHSVSLTMPDEDSLVTMFADDGPADEGSNGKASCSKRRKRSQGSSKAKKANAELSPAHITDSFLAKINRDIRSQTTR